MNSELREEEILEIEDRLSKSTKGPWIAMIEGLDHESGDSFIMTGVEKGGNIWSKSRGEDIYISGGTIDDLRFIANAKQDIEKLLSEIKSFRNI